MKLDPAFFGDRRLFDGVHLALHLPQLSGRLLVAANEESCGPENNNSRRRRDRIVGALLILRTGQCSGSR